MEDLTSYVDNITEREQIIGDLIGNGMIHKEKDGIKVGIVLLNELTNNDSDLINLIVNTQSADYYGSDSDSGSDSDNDYDNDSDSDSDNETANWLLEAIEGKNYNVIKLLLKHGVDQKFALLEAVYTGNFGIIELVLDNWGWNQEEEEEALKFAIQEGQSSEDIVKLLLEKTLRPLPDHFLEKYENPETVVFMAVEVGRGDIVELFINNYDINIKDSLGNTLLMMAAYYGNFDIAKLLIDVEVNVDLKNKKGNTALMIAKDKGNTNIVNLINGYNKKRAEFALWLGASDIDLSVLSQEVAEFMGFGKRKSKKRSIKRKSKKRSIKRKSKKRSIKRKSKKRSIKRKY
jgi:ankyrin repeat protein